MHLRNLKLRSLVAAVLTAATLMAPLTSTIAEATTLKAKSNVNVRAGSSAATEKVGYVYSGQVVKYLGTENGWYKIDLDGIVGYTHRDYWQGNTVTATANVNVRKSANSLAEKVTFAGVGTEAAILGRSGSWLYIDINGSKGYSYKAYWDLSDTLFYSLSVVTGEAGDSTPAPAPAPEPSPADPVENPAEVSSGDQYRLFTALPGYFSADEAQSGTNAARTMAAGTYYIFKVYSGIYNITTVKGTAGAWINPAKNKAPDTTAPAPTPDPEPTPEPTPDPAPSVPGGIKAGDEYGLINSVNGYGTAADAAAGIKSLRVMNQGRYFVYKVFSGMYNISTVENTPGAWINPADNNGKDAPAPDPVTEGETTSALGEQIVKNALGVLGAPYVYAGESWAEGGFDCSGLTYYAYLKEGIRLPRTASQQWAGISNKVSTPQPGDIIAFEREDGSVYHVGIYYKDGTMIHSPKPGYFVEIKSLEWHYRNDLVKGYLRPTK